MSHEGDGITYVAGQPRALLSPTGGDDEDSLLLKRYKNSLFAQSRHIYLCQQKKMRIEAVSEERIPFLFIHENDLKGIKSVASRYADTLPVTSPVETIIRPLP